MISIPGAAVQLLYYDSLLFFAAIIISIIYIYKHHKGIERYVFYAYTVVTLSITNMFVKPVQDYLIIIPRTFIFYYKVFAGLSPFDIFIIVMFVYICVRYLNKQKYRRILFSKNILTSVFKCALIILFLSFVGFGIYMLGDNPVDSISQIRCLRSLLSAFVFIFIAQMVINRCKSDVQISRIITTIFWINFIVLLSEFFSSFLIQDICWERAGHKVTILDQTSGAMALIYIPFILCKTPFLKKWMLLSAYFFFSLLIYNAIKTWFLILGMAVLIIIFWGVKKRRIQKRLFFLSLIGFVAVLVFSISVAKGGTASVKTREGQNEMLYEAFIENPVNILCGIGHGGMIKKQNVTEDGGEIRAIDSEKSEDTKYTTTYQVPFFNTIKSSGIIGLLFNINLFFLMLRYSYSRIRYGWYFSCCLAFMAVTQLILGPNLFIGDPQNAIYYIESFVIFKLLLQWHGLKELERRKHMNYSLKI